jgi:hypothetical protein
LLIPGFLYAILSLLISSNRILVNNTDSSISLLKFSQLLSFGVTIAKYAADQMILSRLQPNQSTYISSFFKRRVIPLSLIFCLVLLLNNKLEIPLFLCICIPIEVFIIITTIELNISKKYYQALFLNLLGYPSIFLFFIFLSIFLNLKVLQIGLIFLFFSSIKFFLAIFLRNNNYPKNSILTESAQVPLQQVGNFLIFKVDQVIISTNLINMNFFNCFIPIDYLFYSKFVELFSGIATSLGPMITKIKYKESISIKPLLKNKVFLSIILIALISQFLGTFYLIKSFDTLHFLLIIPFMIVTLLIVPVNMINYEIFRINKLKTANLINFCSILISTLIFIINIKYKSPILFAFIVPIQMASFLIIYYFFKQKKYV